MNNKTDSNGSATPKILLWVGGVILLLIAAGYFLYGYQDRALREKLVKQEALVQTLQQEKLAKEQQALREKLDKQEALLQTLQQEKVAKERHPSGEKPVKQESSRQTQKANSSQSSARDISSRQMTNLVTEYYNTRSEWAGTFTLENVKRWRLEDIDSERKRAHVEYRYAPVPDNRQGRTDTGFDQRTFDFVWTKDSWQVTGMGANMSGHP